MKYYAAKDVINMLRIYVHGAKRIQMLEYLVDKDSYEPIEAEWVRDLTTVLTSNPPKYNYHCSNCDHLTSQNNRTNYCPDCGARMKQEITVKIKNDDISWTDLRWYLNREEKEYDGITI